MGGGGGSYVIMKRHELRRRSGKRRVKPLALFPSGVQACVVLKATEKDTLTTNK